MTPEEYDKQERDSVINTDKQIKKLYKEKEEAAPNHAVVFVLGFMAVMVWLEVFHLIHIHF